MNALLDTCLLIDFLNKVENARLEMARYRRCSISVITWMEVMAGATPQNAIATEDFLRQFEQLPIDEKVAKEAVLQRQTKRIKLPDAIILATAYTHNLLLVTRNIKDFSADVVGVRIPY